MAKAFKPQVLTGNALHGGESVWWTGARWSDDFADAMAASTPAEVEMFEALAVAPFTQGLVVGAYLAEVRQTPQGLMPATRREAIRAAMRPTFDYMAGAEEATRAA
ncbi:Protein of unknown function [Albimonas donghaensis]|uniref:DUF2849 domain-containing protein n=2 Tax=Albimonas donghaensis TaxID=356660 RepID=A0A1H2WTM9_9RHOB|nr:Protein of unknown function [Albimonas donghaensis]